MPGKRTNTAQGIGWLLLLALLLAGGWFLCATGFFAALGGGVDSVRAYIARFAPYSHGVFFLVQLLGVIFAPLPSNISAAAGGLLFGTWTAFALTIGAVLCGSMLVFLLARRFGKGFAERFVSRRLSRRYVDVLDRGRDRFLALAFLFPYFPDDVLCILAGLTDLAPRRFFVLVLFTRPWGLLFASALGGSSFHLPLGGLAVLGGVGAVLFWLGMKYGGRLEEWLLACSEKGDCPLGRFLLSSKGRNGQTPEEKENEHGRTGDPGTQ